MERESSTPTPYAVICPVHGRVYLTREEYDYQMGAPNSLWKCPRSVLSMAPGYDHYCDRVSDWDDDTYETYLEGLENRD